MLLTICPNQTFLQDFYFAIRVLEIHPRYFLHEANLLYFFSDENKLLLLRVGEVKIKLIDYCTYFEFRLRLCHVSAMHASYGFVVLLMVTDRLFPFFRWMS